MTLRVAKKIARRWMLREWVWWYKEDYPPWRRQTIDTALDIWYAKRFENNSVPDGAW